MAEPVESEHTAKNKSRNQEIKLTAKDTEYYRLKMRKMCHRRLKQKSECPTCGKLLSQRVLQVRHKCKCTLQPTQEQITKTQQIAS
jgi:hypothetical protein